jgi:hypothetical protein|tara:strand:+ start:284 stop:514 length:231 start_codon:yes stop_codon:yes gene_type:complete
LKSRIHCVKIDGHPNLVKDLSSGAIINIDDESINKARMKKQRIVVQEKEMIELKNDVSEIKQMLAQLTKKMVESNV